MTQDAASRAANLNRIEPGDFVSVTFPPANRDNHLEGIVTYVPQATGDAWHIRPVTRSGPNGWIDTCAVVYIQQYESMQLQHKTLASKDDLRKFETENMEF